MPKMKVSPKKRSNFPVRTHTRKSCQEKAKKIHPKKILDLVMFIGGLKHPEREVEKELIGIAKRFVEVIVHHERYLDLYDKAQNSTNGEETFKILQEVNLLRYTKGDSFTDIKRDLQWIIRRNENPSLHPEKHADENLKSDTSFTDDEHVQTRNELTDTSGSDGNEQFKDLDGRNCHRNKTVDTDSSVTSDNQLDGDTASNADEDPRSRSFDEGSNADEERSSTIQHEKPIYVKNSCDKCFQCKTHKKDSSTDLSHLFTDVNEAYSNIEYVSVGESQTRKDIKMCSISESINEELTPRGRYEIPCGNSSSKKRFCTAQVNEAKPVNKCQLRSAIHKCKKVEHISMHSSHDVQPDHDNDVQQTSKYSSRALRIPSACKNIQNHKPTCFSHDTYVQTEKKLVTQHKSLQNLKDTCVQTDQNDVAPDALKPSLQDIGIHTDIHCPSLRILKDFGAQINFPSLCSRISARRTQDLGVQTDHQAASEQTQTRNAESSVSSTMLYKQSFRNLPICTDEQSAHNMIRTLEKLLKDKNDKIDELEREMRWMDIRNEEYRQAERHRTMIACIRSAVRAIGEIMQSMVFHSDNIRLHEVISDALRLGNLQIYF